MTEMIERVAKAMAAKCRRDHDWPFWLDEARAAIEAMREPTDEQRTAYWELSHKTETMVDAHWQRAIDAALNAPSTSAPSS